jgi:hypothetical protein
MPNMRLELFALSISGQRITELPFSNTKAAWIGMRGNGLRCWYWVQDDFVDQLLSGLIHRTLTHHVKLAHYLLSPVVADLCVED